MGGYVTRSLDFTGRTGVIHYWRAQRPLALILLMGPVISMALLLSSLPKWTALIGLIPILFVYIASIALGVRRLHDRGRSGWWLMFYASPLAFSCSPAWEVFPGSRRHRSSSPPASECWQPSPSMSGVSLTSACERAGPDRTATALHRSR